MNELIGYKVVRGDYCGKHWSATILGSPVMYELNEETIPKDGCGPLAIFDSKESARNFSKKKPEWYYKIFRCKYVPSIDESLWYMGKMGNKISCNIFPSGTLLADSITPIEIVK